MAKVILFAIISKYNFRLLLVVFPQRCEVTANQCTYNYKERNEDFGLNLLDYGARWYDGALGRWWSVDPLGESTADIATYSYGFNSPIVFIDPDGMSSITPKKYHSEGNEFHGSRAGDVSYISDLIKQSKEGMALYSETSGLLLNATPVKGEKTAIYTVNTRDKSYDPNNPWKLARRLTYTVGSETDNFGVTGISLRLTHPRHAIATPAGQQVYVEDLKDMTTEFNNLVKSGIPEFEAIKNDWFVSRSYQNLVTNDAKYDIKSRITTDGTPSYAAVVIGEWSFYNGRLHRYDDYGNIAYGVFGRAAGLTEGYLLRGSGWNQLWKGITLQTQGFGDEGRDIYMMKIGFSLYKSGYFNNERP